jgi:hypothetical protein
MSTTGPEAPVVAAMATETEAVTQAIRGAALSARALNGTLPDDCVARPQLASSVKQ